MSSVPGEPNPRTTALGQHRIESAIAFWRNGDQIVQREPEPRRQQYTHAVAQVLATLATIQNIPALIVSYYSMSQERLDALARACDSDGGFPLNRGICEDSAYYRRFQEIVVASQQGGPSARR